MKRSHTGDTIDSRHVKARASYDSPMEVSSNTASPAWSSVSASPAHRYPPRNSRPFFGCSRITDYEFEDKLGEGTFGEVHKARNRHTGQLVALKRILMHNEKDGIPITAIREIKILKQLRHKNIVPLTDIAVERGDSARKERGSIYMVFPYMDHDLAGLLDNPSVRLSTSQIKTYLKQLLEGTAYLHHNRILHRDMKAANLLINNEGILQIADFGLARGMEDENREYTNCVVTRWYRPPELFLGERRYTSAIDMWGVGCVFGELLKLRPILQGQDDMDQLKRIFHLCGSPTQKSMPGWDKLRDAHKVKFEPSPRRVKDEFAKFDTHAADLMDKLLVLDPHKRLTALEALEHDYFYSKPLPADPADLPKYDASHEYDRRRNKQHDHHSSRFKSNKMPSRA
ncbi:kinase-like domain-containing protein [Radiomyces spectabilis]|uniref:kinase-like domain-containing protein n=1 Tax=Radiomyces spectabilis TaxID=64574 RepID=UPI00221F8A9B|nr:kinase-like domain-containing protein [Radiomyces spectabilis]KAI8381088.1 kinase-like domain-containing protein [Radiomyces spectabilis]